MLFCKLERSLMLLVPNLVVIQSFKFILCLCSLIHLVKQFLVLSCKLIAIQRTTSRVDIVSIISKTNPAEVMITESTNHVHASLILLNWLLALRTWFSVQF